MNIRPLRTILCAAFAISVGCEQEAPTEIPTVELAIIAGAPHGGAPLTTPMTQEVTSVPEYFGDPDGRGAARLTVNVGQREVCWDISVENITLPATASHIHRAPAGIRGGIVVFLSPPDASGTSRGCTSGLDRELLQDILTNSADYYVNVHTTDFAPGAVRGQFDS